MEIAMNKLKILPLALILILASLTRLANAQTSSSDSAHADKVKAEVVKRLANKKTRVKIKLATGEEVKGRLEQAGDSSFTISEDKTGGKVETSYGAVAALKGRGMSTLTKVAIAGGIGVGVLAVVVIVALRNFDPFEGGITVR
jgi:small nuclear ribonucleoprotein (snRNP)-like protein